VVVWLRAMSRELTFLSPWATSRPVSPAPIMAMRGVVSAA